MVNPNNLHLIKAELINLNDLIEEYSEASHAYCEELTSYRIIASYHHITASLIASEPAICKESQWYESRVRVNEFLWILRLN